MEAFSTLTSKITPIIIDNIDTDQIIPARFLKQTTREGFGKNLFRDWRFDKNDHPIPHFPLNQSSYSGKVLFAGDNFGCGSSREHAAWAIFDYGFRVVISTSFADIFKNNALNNGLLPIEISSSFHSEIEKELNLNSDCLVNINLENQTIEAAGVTEKFQINLFKKWCLTEGKDEFTYLADLKENIIQFEEKTRTNEL